MKFVPGIKRDELFTLILHRGIGGHSLGRRSNHTKLQMGANFFANRMIPPWNQLPERAVSSYNVGEFKETFEAKTGAVRFGSEHKAYPLNLLLRLIICLSETKKNKYSVGIYGYWPTTHQSGRSIGWKTNFRPVHTQLN